MKRELTVPKRWRKHIGDEFFIQHPIKFHTKTWESKLCSDENNKLYQKNLINFPLNNNFIKIYSIKTSNMFQVSSFRTYIKM